MKPIKFEGCNIELGEGQKEYNTLPAFYDANNGQMVTCWKLSESEIEMVQKTGVIYLSTSTFNQPFQPVFLSANIKDVIRYFPSHKPIEYKESDLISQIDDILNSLQHSEEVILYSLDINKWVSKFTRRTNVKLIYIEKEPNSFNLIIDNII
jgi:hypothetical protein